LHFIMWFLEMFVSIQHIEWKQFSWFSAFEIRLAISWLMGYDWRIKFYYSFYAHEWYFNRMNVVIWVINEHCLLIYFWLSWFCHQHISLNFKAAFKPKLRQCRKYRLYTISIDSKKPVKGFMYWCINFCFSRTQPAS